MPNLRDATIIAHPDNYEGNYAQEPPGQTSGVDAFGNEFTLQGTDIQPYVADPELAQMEADVTQARYGGSAIQDPSPSDPSQGQAPVPAGPPGTQQQMDFSRRGDFENSVFKQIASENIPDGNPFQFNPVAAMNAISKRDLPDLFEREFQGQVTWQDRHLLDDDQKKYWMAAVKQYRAHIGSGLKAERETAINAYNQMMNQFDNAAKEQSAAAEVADEKRQAQKKRRLGVKERSQELVKNRTQSLVDEGDIIKQILDLGEPRSDETKTEIAQRDVLKKRLEDVRSRRKAIDAELGSRKTPGPKSEVSDVPAMKTGTKAKAIPGKVKKKGGKASGVARKKVPTGQKTVVRTAMHKGNKVLIYSDGSKAYADE